MEVRSFKPYTGLNPNPYLGYGEDACAFVQAEMSETSFVAFVDRPLSRMRW